MPATLSKAITGPACRHLLFFCILLGRSCGAGTAAGRGGRAGQRGRTTANAATAAAGAPAAAGGAGGNRRHGDAARGEHQQGADQHHRPHARTRSIRRASGISPKWCASRPGCRIDTSGTNADLDPRHLLLRRRRHHRHLHRRHADPDARARIQPRRHAARRPSIWTASRCCAGRRARCSARAPKAARCATS